MDPILLGQIEIRFLQTKDEPDPQQVGAMMRRYGHIPVPG